MVRVLPVQQEICNEMCNVIFTQYSHKIHYGVYIERRVRKILKDGYIYKANQLTGFCMRPTLAFNGLRKNEIKKKML